MHNSKLERSDITGFALHMFKVCNEMVLLHGLFTHLKHISAEVTRVCNPQSQLLPLGFHPRSRLDLVGAEPAGFAHQAHDYHLFEMWDI